MLSVIFLIVIVLYLIERTADYFGHCFNDGLNAHIPCRCPRWVEWRWYTSGRCPRHSITAWPYSWLGL